MSGAAVICMRYCVYHFVTYCIFSAAYRRQKMDTVKTWNKDFIALKQLDRKIHLIQNGKIVVIAPNLIRAEIPEYIAAQRWWLHDRLHIMVNISPPDYMGFDINLMILGSHCSPVNFSAQVSVSGVLCLSRLCVGVLWVLQFPPTSQKIGRNGVPGNAECPFFWIKASMIEELWMLCSVIFTNWCFCIFPLKNFGPFGAGFFFWALT